MKTTTELLESAVRRLGPERAQQMLKAFVDPVVSWCGCALAHGFGNAISRAQVEPYAPLHSLPDGNLYKEMWRAGWRFGFRAAEEFAAPLLGLSQDECRAVSDAHTAFATRLHPNDGDTLLALLEAEAAKIAVRPLAEVA